MSQYVRENWKGVQLLAHALGEILLLNAHADLEHPLLQETSMKIEQNLNPNPVTEVFVQQFCCGRK